MMDQAHKNKKLVSWTLRLGVLLSAFNWIITVQALPEAKFTRLSKPPVIDGCLDEEAWQNVPAYRLEHILYSAEKAAVQTEVYLGYDDDYLYIAVHCLEDGIRKPLAIKNLDGTAGIAMQDGLELFLMPSASLNRYFHFFLAAGGARRQQALRDRARDVNWDIAYLSAAQSSAEAWTAEWAIPLYVISDSDHPADDFCLNICRMRQTEPMEQFTWSPLGTKAARRGFHDPDNFMRVSNAREIKVSKKFAPRVLDALILTPYQAVQAGGVAYNMAVELENPGGLAGEVTLVVQVSPTNAALDKRFGPIVLEREKHCEYTVDLAEPSYIPPQLLLEVDKEIKAVFTPRGVSLLTPGARILTQPELNAYGADEETLGEPIGGGSGYSRLLSQADAATTVSTAPELAETLKEWSVLSPEKLQGRIIRIKSGADIDLAVIADLAHTRPYQAFLEVPAGVTVAGDRGCAGSLGPRLRFVLPADAPADSLASRMLFALNPGARLTGLRILGPDLGHLDEGAATTANSRFQGVRLDTGAMVDNCEISNFNWANINISASNTVVRCNELANSAYPVLISGGQAYALIEGNLIRWAWHGIAGGGQQNVGYEAAYNHFIHIGPGWQAHAVDMHAWRQMMRGHGAEYPYLSLAGNSMKIHHNTFADNFDLMQKYRAAHGRVTPSETSADICVRGVPRQGVEIYNNRCVNADPGRACILASDIGALPGSLDRANFWVYDNVYGTNNVLIPRPYETRPRINFLKPALDIPLVKLENNKNKWSTKHVNILAQNEEMPVEIKVEALAPHQIRHLTLTVSNSETDVRELYAGELPPQPGEVVLSAADFQPGCYVLTVTAEDERGITGQYSTSFTVP